MFAITLTLTLMTLFLMITYLVIMRICLLNMADLKKMQEETHKYFNQIKKQQEEDFKAGND